MKRLLLIHNFYRYAGGEDAAVEAQLRLCREAGWQVELYSVRSAEVQAQSLGPKLLDYAQLPYSFSAKARLKKFLRGKSFDVAHLHNLTPFLSASVLAALPRELPRVQTLHNFRAFCVNGLFLRDGRPCEDCPKHSDLNAVIHRCHEGSLATSVGLSLARGVTRNYRDQVDLYACPSAFTLAKHAEHGFDPKSLRPLPNFVADPGRRSKLQGPGLYLSRFSAEKGARVLAEALLKLPGLPLTLAGSGPVEAEIKARLAGAAPLRWTGWLEQDGVTELLATAAFVVVPSICYDNQPLGLLQALAMGLPIIASRIGGLPELVEDGVNGYLVEPGDVAALAQALQRMHAAGPDERQRMGAASRKVYETAFSPQRHLQGLEALYDAAAQVRAAA